jgi:hypothetical protein
LEKTSASATLSITNPTLPDLGSNPARHGGKPVTNCPSYVMAKLKFNMERFSLKDFNEVEIKEELQVKTSKRFVAL